MSHAEHTALATRVDRLADQILAVEPRRIRTVFHVYKRGHETPCRTAADAHRLAKLDPVIELVGEYPDLDVLIDSETGARIQRAANDTTFDELAEGVETIDVVIPCYLEQLPQIRSNAPITATTGGTQAGKTRALVWWLFRQWLILGHGVDDAHDIAAVLWWVREDSGKLYRHAVLWLLRLWPSEVFTGKLPTKSTKSPSLSLIDGSRIDFKHAANSGSKAGTSLRSESVVALVCDELSAVHHEENWREMKSRVAKTGGPIAVAFTPTAGHWSAHLAKQAPSSGGSIVVRSLIMFNNPWWPLARIWVDLLKDGAVTESELEEKLLAAVDPIAATYENVTDPNVRRMRFGEEQSLGLTLWALWNPDTMVHREREAKGELERGGQILPNITGKVFGKHFGKRNITRGGGKDFNTSNGVTVIFRVFGDPQQPTVYVFDEVSSSGPTIVNAEDVAEKYPGLCMFCDPTGASSGRHASHGSTNTTDAEEMRTQGLLCEPANGWAKRVGKSRQVAQLSQLDSINVMHRAMRLGLLIVHARCAGVIRAMAEMQSKPDGSIQKTSGSGSISDRISDYGDALRYGVWPIWRHLLTTPAKVHR